MRWRSHRADAATGRHEQELVCAQTNRVNEVRGGAEGKKTDDVNCKGLGQGEVVAEMAGGVGKKRPQQRRADAGSWTDPVITTKRVARIWVQKTARRGVYSPAEV